KTGGWLEPYGVRPPPNPLSPRGEKDNDGLEVRNYSSPIDRRNCHASRTGCSHRGRWRAAVRRRAVCRVAEGERGRVERCQQNVLWQLEMPKQAGRNPLGRL